MQRRFMVHRFALLGLLAFALGGCGIFGDGEEELTGDALVQHNIEEYESLQASLENNRTDAMGKSATEAAAVGNRLFWLQFPTFDATLHSLDTESGTRVNYTFGVGDSNTWNWRASNSIVVTAVTGAGAGIEYEAYDINQPGQLLGTLSMASPGGGVRWYAYAPDGNQVYIVQTGTPNLLLRWTVGAAQAETVMSLEEAGMSVVEFWDFGVEGNTAILIESGRVWSLDIAAKKATWLENETQAMAAQWDPKGVFYLAATGPFFYSYDTLKNRDLEAEIEASGYSLNSTYDRIHLYSQGGARNGDDVAYIGSYGLFLYDLGTKKARPALLDARDNSIVYRHPVLLENGKLFVQGLESTSGATGAEGGWYEVDY